MAISSEDVHYAIELTKAALASTKDPVYNPDRVVEYLEKVVVAIHDSRYLKTAKGS